MKLFSKQKAVNQVVLLDVNTILSNRFQPRRQFEEKALAELAQSISENGLLQPVTVRPAEGQDGKYELIAGERRLMACRLLGRDKIAAIIERVDDKQSASFALIENLQRRDLNYFEQAEGIQRLMQLQALTQEQLAKQIGKAQPTVANKLRLLAFSQPMRDKLLDNGLTERHARALLRLNDEQAMQDALTYIVDQRLNVGESERYIDALLAPVQTEPEQAHPNAPAPTRLFVVKDMRIFLNTITKAVSTMKLAGIEIDTAKQEDEEFIHYVMKIPKKGVYRSHSA